MTTGDRTKGIRRLLEQFSPEKYSNKKVAVKANFNSADPFPASTHPDTLREILNALKTANASIVVAERSGMRNTRKVLTSLGIYNLVREYNGTAIDIDTLDKNQFSRFHGEHWKRGFLVAQPFLDADFVISTCCLKTHRFGGHFTLSLKNSVGAIARCDPEDKYDYMAELHGSPHQRKMIAEINSAFPCDLVILDAVRGFSTMGPEQGTVIEPNILLASSDRVAIDAVGVAVLRYYSTTPEVEKGTIFEQEQIKRAAELNIGAKSPEDIEIVPLDRQSRNFSDKLKIL